MDVVAQMERDMGSRVPDEQLWSWIDAGSPELAAHLEVHPEDADRIERLRATLDGVGEAARPPASRVPERVGAYAVRGVLGRGAMGVVYEAEQETTRQPVALKVVHAGLLGSERAIAYFQRETRVLARLSHPGIAEIYEAGETASGEPYFAMELAAGRPLGRYLADETPPLRERARLVQRIAAAVGAAHAQGVIHRDLKPANVLVDDAGQPKVLDFGLARFSRPDAGSLLSNPGSQRLVGTLPYMSPEQARGLLGQVDERSDVYALGILLYEAIAGRRPYAVEGLSIPEAVRAICDAVPARLEPRPDADLETIVLRALEKDPAHRYADANALAGDLDRYLAGERIVARPPGPWERCSKWVVRRRRPVVAAVLAAAAAIGGSLLAPPEDAGPDFERSLTGKGYEKLSPFEGVRWDRDVVHVQVDGRWYELEAVGDLHAHLLLGFCRQTAGPLWRKRFAEDLVETLARMKRPPGKTVRLRLWDPERGESVVLPEVPLTAAKRRRVWEAHSRAPYQDVRWNGDDPEVRLDDVWYGLRSIEKVDVATLFESARRVRADWKAEFRYRLTYHLIDVLGRSPGETVALELVDLASGDLLMLDAVPYSYENDRRLHENDRSREAPR